jgi:hypothetical protein
MLRIAESCPKPRTVSQWFLLILLVDDFTWLNLYVSVGRTKISTLLRKGVNAFKEGGSVLTSHSE